MKQIAWSGRRLEQITTPEPGLRSEHVLELSERGLECFDLEILTVGFDLDSSGPQAVSGNMDAVLYYSNRMAEGFSVQRSIQARLRSVGGRYIATFPLSSRADWALGGEAGKLKLVFPVPGRIVDVEFHRKDELMPRLLFENSGYLGSKGFLHLTDTRRTAQLDIEAGSVSGAVAAYVALTRPNKRFARLNSSVPERDILRKIAVDKSGTITLDRSMFPSTGFYELRAWRLDESGKIIGLAGDHIVVAVDS